MALRGLWLISQEQEPHGTVLFSRRYPTVEKRAKIFNGTNYVPVPEDGPFLKALLFELRLKDEGQHFVERRDGCSRINKTSVYTLQIERKDLWPVVAFQNSGLIYVGLPLVEQSTVPCPPLFSVSGISQALDLLSGLLAFMNSNQKSEEKSAKIGQLPSLIMQACPLGTPLDTNLNGLLEDGHIVPGNHPQKPPAWRRNTYKGKPQVNVCIIEKVKSVQYDQRDVADMWQVYGIVTCKCDIEGIAPNVTIGLNLPPNGSPLQDILVHPCVTSLDSAVLTSSSVDVMDDSAFNGPYKFPLIPSSDLFNLCFYTSQIPVPPILGFYQLKEEKSQWKFTIYLKLHESVKNTFEYCKACVPFFNRGPITHLEYKISYGQVEVSKEKSLLVWLIDFFSLALKDKNSPNHWKFLLLGLWLLGLQVRSSQLMLFVLETLPMSNFILESWISHLLAVTWTSIPSRSFHQAKRGSIQLVKSFHQITTSGIQKPQHLLCIELYFSKFPFQFCSWNENAAKMFYIHIKLPFRENQNIK